MTITKNRLEQLKMPLMCYDIAFKAIFTDEVNILAKMVSDITGIDYKTLENNVILETNELPISTNNEKAKRCDFILRINENNILNLELNSSYYNSLPIKNLSYLCHLFSRMTKRGENYSENSIITQVNLNCYEKNIDKELAKYQLQEIDSHEFYTKNITIFTVNVVKCYELYYNLDNKEDIPNYIRWGALIYNRDFSKIPDIVKNIMTDKERDRIMDKINKLTRDDLFYSELEAIEEAKRIENSKLSYAESKGLEQGIEQGIEQEKVATIKNMIKKDISLKDISDITGKTIEEIKEIIK